MGVGGREPAGVLEAASGGIRRCVEMYECEINGGMEVWICLKMSGGVYRSSGGVEGVWRCVGRIGVTWQACV